VATKPQQAGSAADHHSLTALHEVTREGYMSDIAGAWHGTLPDGATDIAVTVYSDGTANYITRSTFAGAWDRWSPPIPLERQGA
jgi:hypothetical protein